MCDSKPPARAVERLAFLYKYANIRTVSTNNDTKLKKLLVLHKPGTILLAPWLEKHSISRDLQTRYRRSGWLESVGAGAFKKPQDHVTWQGGLYALQHQAHLPIHAGAMTAFALQGFAHYLRLGQENVYLLSSRGTKLPAWFKQHDWGVTIKYNPTSVLPENVGLVTHEEKNYSIQISGPERAMLECLHLAPKEFDLVECFQVMEGLTTLRPQVVQDLLTACTSVKVKRLFLYLAERSGHQWLSFVDMSLIDLGKGVRSLSKGGDYVSKYNLVVPHELAIP